MLLTVIEGATYHDAICSFLADTEIIPMAASNKDFLDQFLYKLEILRFRVIRSIEELERLRELEHDQELATLRQIEMEQLEETQQLARDEQADIEFWMDPVAEGLEDWSDRS